MKNVLSGISIFLLMILFHQPVQAQLQSPSDYLGYELGERFTPHHHVIGYVRHVAENSELATIQTYGRTNQNRELVYLTVTSSENQQNIDEIRTNNLKLTGLIEGEVTDNLKAIIWLSYNIHGNETSSSEAAMKTLYELVNPANRNSKEWLNDSVVIIDPMLNPDGRDRYVNWFNGIVGEQFNPLMQSREHHEPWPGGRSNHYYFDLNRDWAWQTQLETQQRTPIYQSWMPHVHVDFHEQGYNSPYYFAPAAEPFHKAITDWQREFQTEIGKNNVRYFDKEGWLYFTRERFDLFYPSYGDTWPTFNGAIGMTYEQAGHGLAGVGITTQEGDTLTLKDRLTHHHVSGMSTIEVTAQHADRVVEEFKNHFDRAINNPSGTYKTFVVKGDNHPDKVHNLLQFLESQNIRYGLAGRSTSTNGYNYSTTETERVSINENDILISAHQPQSQMVRVMFEPNPELSDSLTYDITAWESHYRFGLNGYALESRIDPREEVTSTKFREHEITGSLNPYAYLMEWNSMDDARFLAFITTQDVRSRFSKVPFSVDGKKFERGTLVITRENNRHLGENFDRIINNAALSLERNLHGASTGFVMEGADFGSSDVAFIEKPEVAVFLGEGTSSLQAGEVWHFFDQQLHYPATMFHTDHFSRVNLHDFNTIVLPSGSYSGVLSEDSFSTLNSWVRSGGNLIVLGNTNSLLTRFDGVQLTRKQADTEADSDSDRSLRTYADRSRDATTNRIPGSIFKVTLDPTHPLAFGYGTDYFSLKSGSQSFNYLDNGWNVGTLRGNALMSGFAGQQAQQYVEDTLIFGVQNHGSGSIVYMTDNPLFRGFWENGKLFMANALFFVGN